MSLSSRAQAYIATLKRNKPVSVDVVTSALEHAGCPAFEVWLDFHSRFAGYEEAIGREIAVWGIVHGNPHWLDPGEASVDRVAEFWRVVCADVHPSYDYWLDSNGEFVSLGGGGRSESFDKKVERDAIFWEAALGNRSWEMDLELVETPGLIDVIRNSASGIEIVSEASDKYATCMRSHDVIIIERAPKLGVWVASDARERVKSLIRMR